MISLIELNSLVFVLGLVYNQLAMKKYDPKKYLVGAMLLNGISPAIAAERLQCISKTINEKPGVAIVKMGEKRLIKGEKKVKFPSTELRDAGLKKCLNYLNEMKVIVGKEIDFQGNMVTAYQVANSAASTHSGALDILAEAIADKIKQ